jgi:hypothetical protein
VCHYAECGYGVYVIMLSVVMLCVIMMSAVIVCVITLSIVMLCVIMLYNSFF